MHLAYEDKNIGPVVGFNRFIMILTPRNLRVVMGIIVSSKVDRNKGVGAGAIWGSSYHRIYFFGFWA